MIPKQFAFGINFAIAFVMTLDEFVVITIFYERSYLKAKFLLFDV